MAYASPSKEELLASIQPDIWVSEYETERDAEMKKVAAWYAEERKKQWEKRQKEGERERVRQQQTQWQQSSRERWTEMLGFQPIVKGR